VIMPRTHMLLSVGLGRGAGADRERPDREGDGACEHGRAEDETRYLVDGGFGGIGLTAPLRIGDPAEQPSLFEPQRIATVPEGRLLQARVNGEWRDLYVFGDGPQEAIDFEVANWFTSTHPDSRFKRNLIVSLASPTIRHVLFNRELSAYRTGGVERSSIDDPEQLLEVLESVFHLSFPARTRFGDAGAPWAR
jgi:N-hydroxyarylamine O-acetyltransferase